MSRIVDEGDTPGPLARLIGNVLSGPYRRGGWPSVAEQPIPDRCVLIAAPHTSNWDFPNFLGVTQALGIRPHFMGKKSLFRWPMGGFMRQMGGVSVDRSAAK